MKKLLLILGAIALCVAVYFFTPLAIQLVVYGALTVGVIEHFFGMKSKSK